VIRCTGEFGTTVRAVAKRLVFGLSAAAESGDVFGFDLFASGSAQIWRVSNDKRSILAQRNFGFGAHVGILLGPALIAAQVFLLLAAMAIVLAAWMAAR